MVQSSAISPKSNVRYPCKLANRGDFSSEQLHLGGAQTLALKLANAFILDNDVSARVKNPNRGRERWRACEVVGLFWGELRALHLARLRTARNGSRSGIAGEPCSWRWLNLRRSLFRPALHLLDGVPCHLDKNSRVEI